MRGKEPVAGIFRWRGLMADADRRTRGVAFGVLALACGALVFCQMGIIPAGSVRVLSLLAPVAVGALLYGTLPGLALGLVAGCAAFAHALGLPLDYYEKYFAAPASSIMLFALAGLLSGALFSLACRKEGRLRILFLALACLVVSWFASTWFQVNSYLVTLVSTFTIPEELWGEIANLGATGAQILVDWALVFLCAAGAVAIDGRRASRQGARTIRETFQGWLAVVMTMAFLFTAAGEYTAVTVIELSDADEEMGAQIDYLAAQLGQRDAWLAHLEAEADVGAAARGRALAESTAGITDDLSIGKGGVAVIAEDGTVVSSNVEGNVGRAFSAVVGAGLRDGFDESLFDADGLTEYYLGNGAEMGYLKASQMSYARMEQVGSYQIMVALPASEVFAMRPAAMAAVAIVFLLLFGLVFALAGGLLDSVVVRRIDETNDILGRITGGDLEQSVQVLDPAEFASLSAGINSTVGSLKESIAQVAGRMDAELATARAIQENALPRVFPPYPDILKFDVYATMNAARQVGGDFYDFFLIGDGCTPDAGKLGFVIADVSGKGVPAALFMMKAKTQLRDYMESGMELGEAVENANRQLCDGNDAGMFVTAWAGVLDYATGHMDFVNAGHNPPLLWQGRGGAEKGADAPRWRWLTEKSGLPLGLFDGFPYEAHSVDCQIGDQLLLYTDGVTEAMSADGELYGEGRLEELARESYTLHPRELIERVRRSVAAHAAGAEQSDDITMLALEVGVPPEITATLSVPADVGELPRVNEFIHTELDRRLCPKRAQNQLDVAVEELFVNVCRYAYGGLDENVGRVVRVSCTYSAEPPSITVDIADDGAPFDPLAKPDAATADEYGSAADIPIGGLGILMAKNSVDEMRYERVDGSNVVSIVKKW